jgi:protein-tyrosine phosphatase
LANLEILGIKNGDFDMIKVLFVCWGNICRSPMAEYIFKDMVKKEGIADRFHIESAATSTEELGNPVYPPARDELKRHGIDCKGHSARQVKRSDYDEFDYIIAMEDIHLRIMRDRFFGGRDDKISLCMDYSSTPGKQIADPWYTGDFVTAYRQIKEGCVGLLQKIKAEN